jgi:hypothetical protein
MLKKLRRIILFFLIFLTPVQLSFHYWPAFSSISSVKVDYLSPTLYLSDIIIIAFLVLDIPRSKRATVRLSNLSPAYYLLLLFTVTNIMFSFLPLLSFYKYLRLLLYYLLFKTLIGNRHEFIKTLPFALPLSLVWVCFLAFWQFGIRHSVGGLWFWLGERPLSLTMPMVAKINLKSFGMFLRAYATLPHPNALAGYLSVSIFLLASFRQKFTKPVLMLCLACLFITFSRSGVLATLIMLLYFSLRKRKKYASRLLLFVLILSVAASVLIGDPNSIPGRYLLIKQALLIIYRHPLFGSGLGTFPAVSSVLQPVHNLPLLLLSELGIPLFSLLCLLGLEFFNLLWKNTMLWSRMIIADVILLGLIDHYWLTSVQNLLLLTLVTSWIVIKSREDIYG